MIARIMATDSIADNLPSGGGICPSWGCGAAPISSISAQICPNGYWNGSQCVPSGPVAPLSPITMQSGPQGITVIPSATPIPAPAPMVPSSSVITVVTPTSGPIPPPGSAAAAVAASSTNPLITFLTGSLFAGVPNWVFLGAGALLLFGGKR